MKKKILLIGNTNDLPGVKIDIENYTNFFKSPYGGNWNDSEIIVKTDPSRLDLMIQLKMLQNESLDYLIVIFSGHGGQERETMLELNSKGELIGESALSNISKRQLNIYDCCRSYSESINESVRRVTFSNESIIESTRERFEARIMEAIPQQVSLYSCSIGEVSHDTVKGGLYSTNLISSGKSIRSGFKLVTQAHVEASDLTMSQSIKIPPYKVQTPEAILPRSLSSQQLIFSISPL